MCSAAYLLNVYVTSVTFLAHVHSHCDVAMLALIKRMCKQCVPGTLFPLTLAPGYQVSDAYAGKTCKYWVTARLLRGHATSKI